jgi:pyrroloquinoline quinone biosynthesis protein D
MPMSSHVLLKQSFGFFIEELEGECLLYRIGAHKAIHLNESASLIWKLCDGSRSMADIIAFLQQEYPDAQSTVVEDVREAVEQLVREGALLEVAAS